MRRIIAALLLMVGLFSGAASGRCESPDEGWKAVGVRGGFSATSRHQYFHRYEAFASYGLPWSLRGDSGWGVALLVNGAAGALHAAGDTAGTASLGPGVIFDRNGKGIAFDFGGDLVGLTRYHFGRVDLNGHLLFEGHVGVTYRFDSGPGVGYRFQHISNGGLGAHGSGNTGLDLHMFSVSWNF
jgi:hypothetical protein